MWRLASRPDVAVDVASAGLACCSLEVEAAGQRGLLVASETVPHAATVTVLVVAGTVTTALEPALVRLFDEHAQRGPVIVVSFGACATSGGPHGEAGHRGAVPRAGDRVLRSRVSAPPGGAGGRT